MAGAVCKEELCANALDAENTTIREFARRGLLTEEELKEAIGIQETTTFKLHSLNLQVQARVDS